MNKKIPSVSIVIPMYNAEKYIGDCLDNILAQTFQDFEVIVVDDCSTDNSRAVVESYIKKFTKKKIELKLFCLKKNSGASGIPRKQGSSLARGEYISFIDADDMITKTAFEELYPIAKKFNADVVHCERYFEINDDKIRLHSYQSGEFVTAPTLITENFAERVNDLYNRRFLWNLWTKLIRRDYFLSNDFPMINAIAADCHSTILLVCSAKRYVRVPNVVNLYRVDEKSISHKKEDVSKTITKWLNALIEGFGYIDKFLDRQKFFVEHKDVKNLALETWVRECCGYLNDIYAQFPAWKLDELIRNEFKKFGNTDALTAFLFSRMNVFNVNLNRQQQIIFQQQQIINQLQK